jgi:hypothetical protein
MEKIKKGDRVKVIVPVGNNGGVTGAVGTVTNVFKVLSSTIISVEYDECIHGHDNLGTGKPGHCWDSLPCHLEKIK